MSGLSENTELFGFKISAVILMDYEKERDNRLLKLGYFAITLFMHITCPILATVCSVDDFKWPLTKDTVVIRMAKRTFAFALPGLLYGLQFPKFIPEALIVVLQGLFMKYGHYKDLNDKGLGYPVEDNEPNMWDKLRPEIEPMAHETLKRLGQSPGISRFSVRNHNRCTKRAARMSACTKFVIQSMNTGTLTSMFIKIRGTNPADVDHDGRAYASVSAFSCLVDSVELSWVVFYGLNHLVKDPEPPNRGYLNEIGFQIWHLSEEGNVDFMQLFHSFAEEEEESMNEEDQEEGDEASATPNNIKGKQIKP